MKTNRCNTENKVYRNQPYFHHTQIPKSALLHYCTIDSYMTPIPVDLSVVVGRAQRVRGGLPVLLAVLAFQLFLHRNHIGVGLHVTISLMKQTVTRCLFNSVCPLLSLLISHCFTNLNIFWFLFPNHKHVQHWTHNLSHSTLSVKYKHLNPHYCIIAQ